MITRRPSIELPFTDTRAVAVGQNGGEAPTAEPDALPGEFAQDLDLDVPAFLRRSEG